MLAIARVERPAWEGLLPEWWDLFRGSPGATPFQSPAWQTAWADAYRRAPFALQVRRGADLVGWFPMVGIRRGCRVLRAAGAGPSDYLHPLAREGEERAVAHALCDWLSSSPCDLVDLQQVRDDQAISGFGEPVAQATCLVLDLPDSYETYLSRLSKSLRYDCRILGRKPFAGGEAKIEAARTPEEAALGLRVFFHLHARRWRQRGLPGAFASMRARRLHEAWVLDAARNDLLRLNVLRLCGEPVGVVYAMRAGTTVFFYQSGFDANHRALSPGTSLVAHTIRSAIEEGDRAFDFLRGDEPYKRRWMPQRVHQNFRLFHARSAAGRAALSLNKRASHTEARLRARFEGRGLW